MADEENIVPLDWVRAYIVQREKREPGFAAGVKAAEERLLVEEELRRPGLVPDEEND